MNIFEESLCNNCNYTYCLLSISKCNHIFHFRCINKWPLKNCPKCNIIVEHINILNTNLNINKKNKIRLGRWSNEENEYVNLIIQEFSNGYIFGNNKLTLIQLLTNILNCSSMRISKKYQKNNNLIKNIKPFNISNIININMNNTNYLNIQKKISKLESNFHIYLIHKYPEQFNNLIIRIYNFRKQQIILFTNYINQNIKIYDNNLYKYIKKRKLKQILIKQPDIKKINIDNNDNYNETYINEINEILLNDNWINEYYNKIK